MKLCIVGSSGHYHYVLNPLRVNRYLNVDIVGISAGSKGERIDKVYKEVVDLGYKPEIYEDYREMFDKLKPDIAVVNCFFGDLASVSIEALKRGINVFTEKPVATTFEDLEKLKQTYFSSKSVFVAMFGIRYKPWFLTAYNYVKNGSIGEIRLLNAQKSYKLGERDEFYKSRKTYGGTIPWVGSHGIDWIRWFSNQEFLSVYASHSKKHNKGHGDLEVSALCHFNLTNEVLASLTIDYFRPNNAPTHDDDRLRVVGTKGIIEVINSKVLLIDDQIPGVREVPLEQGGSIFLDFLKEIEGKGKCMISAEDSFEVTKICLKALQSADEQKVVYL
ncbi:MAG TPA: Gfo/Idh/MocA family oxidoreductase [Defluviitoga sp.]|nr:Gfo/Idh/MocA family oxidoreductase [Defluviitoga sp.]HOP25216.1 Gfo/Idh/MocA family oxidoreductase [Defluviitoga sp.]HPZ29311.1 Gfo/Idh/MocA family oxidoreductase [Defluviitoga sp.]HQD63239.1 Gfo/Idh/MocA family oxidoreductase [Defluviitoga sp.]